jgi:hypothetical protein
MKIVLTKVEIIAKNGKEDYQVWEKEDSIFSKWRLDEANFKGEDAKSEAVSYAKSPGYPDNVIIKYLGEFMHGVMVAKNNIQPEGTSEVKKYQGKNFRIPAIDNEQKYFLEEDNKYMSFRKL